MVAADVYECGQVAQIIETVWGVCGEGPNWLIVVDGDADLDNWSDIWWRIYSTTLPHRDVWIARPRQKGAHQPLVQRGFSSWIAIDATSKFKEIEFPEKVAIGKDLAKKVTERWADLGLE